MRILLVKSAGFDASQEKMSTLLNYFGAAYLINLPQRTDRLASAKKEFLRAGWPMGEGGVQHYPAQTFTERAGFQSRARAAAFILMPIAFAGPGAMASRACW